MEDESGDQVDAMVQAFLGQEHQQLIDGKWIQPHLGEWLKVIDPGTEKQISQVAAGGTEDVADAVEAARRSFEDGRWRGIPASERTSILWKVADLIDKYADELALLECLDNGMPFASARNGQIPAAAKTFRYYAGLADMIHGQTSEISAPGRQLLGYTLREPIGVVGLIVPWNAPLLMAAWKVAGSLAAGCSGVLKPAEETSLTALRLGELLLEAGVPPGVMNVVTGVGETAGASLVAHSDVDKIAFTGSTEVGRLIVRAAAANLKKLTLELGGKSPVVVFNDADLEPAVAAAAGAIFNNAGQICSAGSRLIVQDGIYDEVVAGIIEIARQLRIGYFSDAGVNMGPLISAKQLARVTSYIESGLAEGAECAFGGKTIDSQGFFVEPTVLTGTNGTMRVVQEEIFGPVLAATQFADFEEAARLANDTNYGLASSVFTRDVGRAHAFARRIRAGRVGINVHPPTVNTMPGGGYKQSGWGREHGPHALDEYLEIKSVYALLRES